MKRIGTVVTLVLLIGLPSSALAAPLTYSASFVATPIVDGLAGCPAATDGAMIGGSTLTFTATFADGTLYVADPLMFGTPVASVASVSLGVSAPSPAAAGSPYGLAVPPFPGPAGPLLFWAAFEAFFDPGLTLDPVFGPLVGSGLTLLYKIDFSPVPVPPVGVGVKTGDFGLIEFMPGFSLFKAGTSCYGPAPMSVTEGATGGPTPAELLSFEIE